MDVVVPDYVMTQPCRDFYVAWSSWRGDALMPHRRDVRLEEIKPLLPSIMVLDALSGSDVSFRLVGTKVVDRLGFDPVELRLKNAVEAGGRWIGGQTITSCGLRTCLTEARDASGWAEKRRDGGIGEGGKRRGIGVSAFAHICGLLGTSATVRLLEDGTAALAHSAVDLGQGAESALAQICAGALDIDVDRIDSAPTDSGAAPYNWSTGGSRVT